MRTQGSWRIAAVGAFVFFFSACQVPPGGSQSADGEIRVGPSDVGGVVTSANGPEAGVWVIAETTDLPTKFSRIVVTDERGRYLVPDLPKASYSVWVRGYGLVDSPKIKAEPGRVLDLKAVLAPSAAAAAKYYPAIYWYSMLKIPPAADFGGTTAIPKSITRENWLRQMNNVDCIGCHQLGQESTRTIPSQFGAGRDGWMRRIQSGQSGENMTNRIAGQFGGVPYTYFGDWTDRIAKGELAEGEAPAAPGSRAQYRRDFLGVEHGEALSARPDRLGPAQSDGQCVWTALRLARVLDRQHADPGSEDEQGDVLQDAGRGSEACPSRSDPGMRPQSSRCSLLRTGATKRSGTRGPTITTPCSTRRAGCGSRPRCAAWTTRPSARRARIIRPQRCFRWTARRARWRCSSRRP